MNYLSNIADYIYSFFKEDDNILLYESHKSTPKPFFQYHFLDDIDFDNAPTSDIVIKLNDMKHQFFFNNSYKIYDDNNIHYKNKLNKLKFILFPCLESKNDTTDIMIKHIRKYKGEKNILDIISEDKEYKDLEIRYNKLVKDIEDINNEDNNDENNNQNNTDGMVGVKLDNKKRISLLN